MIWVQQSPRRTGKTSRVMWEVQDLVRKGHRSEIAVLLISHERVHWWAREWQRQYPLVQVPTVLSLRDVHRLRGRQIRFVFVEDVDNLDLGIHDPAIRELDAMIRPLDGIIAVTSSINPRNEISHRQRLTRSDVLKRSAHRLAESRQDR